MAGFNRDELVTAYQLGASLPMVARQFNVPISYVRQRIFDAGVLRSRAEGIRLAANAGRLGSGRRGKTWEPTLETRKKMSEARQRHAEIYAKGTSKKQSGYEEYTRGPNKFRYVHVVLMEQRIGRRLLLDEVVHHIDGNPSNNDINNLALMTRSGHTRLHRREQKIGGGKI